MPTSALYRAVWRWHFWAGLLAVPLAMFLALTGALYLWKPQFEEWRYRDLLRVPEAGPVLPAEAQFAAAAAAHPDASAVLFNPSLEPGRTSELVLRLGRRGEGQATMGGGDRLSVYVNPYTGAVTGEVLERNRFMKVLHDLHGELLAGRPGQFVVELGASWMFVLLLTGFYLWWPRPKFSVWGFLLPRLGARGRVFWRDLHAVPAVWFSAGALFLLATGIPWTAYGGKWFRTLSAAMGEGSPREADAGAHRSELTGWSPPLRAGLSEEIDALASDPGSHAGHEGHDHTGGGSPAPFAMDGAASLPPRISLDRVMEIAAERGVPQPYGIALPAGPTGVISAMSDRHQAFTRTYLHLDQYSGDVLAEVRFSDFGLMGKFFLWGIIAHEGQLFGLANQLLGTAAALGVFAIALSGVLLWWKRRPAGALGVPVSSAALPRPVYIGTLALAVVLPLLAGTLLILLAFDSMFSRRLPWLRPVAR